MSYEAYKLMHLVGVVSLFLALGALVGFETKVPRWAVHLHGTALLVIAVAGFGLAARLGLVGAQGRGFPPWLIGKMVVWLALGGSMVLAKRKLVPRAILGLSLVLLGGLSASLALFKPAPEPLVYAPPAVGRASRGGTINQIVLRSPSSR